MKSLHIKHIDWSVCVCVWVSMRDLKMQFSLNSNFSAFFYQIRENLSDGGEEIENIVRHFDDLDEMTHSTTLPYTFSLQSLIGNINTDRFYTYRGELKVATFVVSLWQKNTQNFFRLTHNTEMQWSCHLDNLSRHHSHLLESNVKISIALERRRGAAACWQLSAPAANWKSKNLPSLAFVTCDRNGETCWDGVAGE